jgi:hypothetical protein
VTSEKESQATIDDLRINLRGIILYNGSAFCSFGEGVYANA